MIKSMTGFGRYELLKDSRKIIVELKSVNHRYLDLNLKLPKKLGAVENDIRNQLKGSIGRGKVDVYISYEESADSHFNIKYNSEIAANYLKNLQEMADEFHLENDIRVSSLSRYPDVFELEEIETDEDTLFQMVQEAMGHAIEQFVESREVEGERLRDDLLGKMEEMEGYVRVIEERSPQIITEYKERLMSKITELMGDNQVDDNRIAMEVTIYADKACVDEEIVRLKSHVEETKNALTSGDAIGRKLDFIAQEMNREANTILSKSTDVEIANMGIELKTLIEKVREQIQNIE